MRTAIYVDGFNFYFGVLKRTPYKWLDLQRLFESLLSRNRVTLVRYFTARVQATPRNPGVDARQDAYLRALAAACPLVSVHYGHYVRRELSMENASPPPPTVRVWKNEEKGSDVNLAVHLVNDAWENREKISPKFTGKAKPHILEIYKLLPKTNCRECGQPTCIMFASLATEGIKGTADCPRLSAVGMHALDDYLSRFNFA